MSKKLLIVVAIIFLLILVGISTYIIKTNKNQSKNGDVENTVSWNEAIRILNSGEVEQVFQSYNLDVTLILEDSKIIKTKASDRDDVIDEVKKCGNTCQNIVVLSVE